MRQDEGTTDVLRFFLSPPRGGTGFSNLQKERHLVGLSNDLSVVAVASSGVLRFIQSTDACLPAAYPVFLLRDLRCLGFDFHFVVIRG